MPTSTETKTTTVDEGYLLMLNSLAEQAGNNYHGGHRETEFDELPPKPEKPSTMATTRSSNQ